jgi:putative transposase
VVEANRRYNILKHYASTGEILFGTSIRTIRRWQKSFKDAELVFGSGFLGLLDKKKNRGNRLSKLPSETLALSNEFIEEVYENSKQSSVYSVWTRLREECEKRGLIAPSLNSFNLRVKVRPVHEQELKRRGKIAAYKYEEFIFELSSMTPRHGDRPFEIVHIDHTELDIELICSQTGKNLGRPWLTLAIDAYSRRCVGFFLTFDNPSYRSCMMVIRDMIQRYNRFPQTIVVDGGLDFSSAYFEALIAYYNCTLKFRPGKKPRFGTLIERLFLTTNKQFVYNLLGNTQLSKDNVRYLVKEFNPKNLAVWNIESLYRQLSEYLFVIYDQLEHSTLGVSPREMFLNGNLKFGERKHKHILYNENFRLMTLPTTKTGRSKVNPDFGVIINHIRYSTPHFRTARVVNEKIPVRFDPFDLGIAYSYVNGMWQRCLSDYYNVFHNRTEKEILLATAEIKELKKGRGRFNLNAKLLAQFLLGIDAAENQLILAQRQKDIEMKQILNQIDPYSNYMLSGAGVNTIKLLSAEPNPYTTGEVFDTFDDSIDEEKPIDMSRLEIFGDY